MTLIWCRVLTLMCVTKISTSWDSSMHSPHVSLCSLSYTSLIYYWRKQFLKFICIVEILLKLRAHDDESFKVDFHVDFSTIEYIAKDVNTHNAHILPDGPSLALWLWDSSLQVWELLLHHKDSLLQAIRACEFKLYLCFIMSLGIGHSEPEGSEDGLLQEEWKRDSSKNTHQGSLI
jgi:hypothetical protein